LETYDAVVVGSGPNGLAAALEIARAGHSVLVVEGEPTPGGGTRTEELTLPGFLHDVCSAIHPLGVLSPFMATVHGIEWIEPPFALAHPFDDGSAAVLERGLARTAARLVPDTHAWSSLFAAFDQDPRGLFGDVLRPIRLPDHPLVMARFGFHALQSAARLVNEHFTGDHAKAIFAGCAAHSIMPLDATGTAAFGLVLAIAAHAVGWPLPKGGSVAIAEAMLAELRARGAVVRTNERITALRELPSARAVLFDVMPGALAAIAGDDLPPGYVEALRRYRHGPGVFKIDWALDGPIPWAAPECRQAGTVHVGGTYEEIAASELAPHEGRNPGRPFVLVAQQSLFDPTRAPPGKHTGWAYCHVANGSTADMTETIESQVERFAPGFRDRIIARHVLPPAALEAHDANVVGGDIGGGANDLVQTLARPFLRWNSYTTPNPRLFLASSATPPGGGVHGMCGYWAARAALHRVLEVPAARVLHQQPA
jgi:phytoene dehydrogenase-like protein